MSSLINTTGHGNTLRALKTLEASSALSYYTDLFDAYSKCYDVASAAKATAVDIDKSVWSQEACDMADRLETITQIKGIGKRLREYDPDTSLPRLALKLSEDVALGHFGFFEKEEVLNLAAKVAICVVMSCAAFVPTEDITKVVIKKNGDGTLYPAMVFGQVSGVISSFQASFLVLVIDRVRLIVGLDKYHVNSVGDDEVARFLEEVNIYQSEGGFEQAPVRENDIRFVLQNISVEIDGRGTEDTEVLTNRNFQRIKGNKIRAGALQVLVDGIIGKAARLHEASKSLQIPEWEWLTDLTYDERQERPDDLKSYVLDAKPGKPVLSVPSASGGFQLRYGRAENSGFGSLGFHPAIFELLDSPLSTGTQIKVSIANRVGSVAAVDSLRPPTVRLRNGDVCDVKDTAQAKSVKDKLDLVLDLGDILVSPNEFVRRSGLMEPSGYVEEWWASDLKQAMTERQLNPQEVAQSILLDVNRLHMILANPLLSVPTVSEALQLCSILGIPMHPHYTFFWDLLTIKDIFALREGIIDYKEDDAGGITLTIVNSPQIKQSLETARIPHRVSRPYLSVYGENAEILYLTLAPGKSIPLGATYSDTLALLKSLSGFEIRKKSSVSVGVAMRRAEIARERKMRPPVHVLFPTGTRADISRDILQFRHSLSVVELNMKLCPSCGTRSPYPSCPFCSTGTTQLYYCPTCRKETFDQQCHGCQSKTLEYMTIVPQTSDLLRAATETLGLQPYPPLRGVTKLTNKSYTPEKLEKGILRQRHNLTCFKDGTIRYDAVNAPLTHFKPSQFHLDIKTLQTLGYLTDRFGEPLESEEQIVELKPQDIILPQDSVDHFKRLSAFLDDLLSRFFKAETFYDFQNPQDLVGALLVGVSPKASVGTVGRIIGFTNARVCYAYPTWHTAKYRGCDGDVDSLTLLLDVFLNYSPTLCPDQVTGLLDTPMLIEPLLPPSIVVKRPSQFDLADSYTREFYMKTEGRPPARSLEGTACIHQDANSGLESTYRYTHWSSTLVTSEPGSSYSYPAPMPDKVSKQIVTASKILAVDVDGLICSLLNNYLVKEILDNLDSYSTQKFRCKGCGETYRRPPVKGACLTCGRELMPSVALSIAEKYILLANELIKTHQVAQPIMDKIRLALDNLQLLSESKKQTSIADFI